MLVNRISYGNDYVHVVLGLSDFGFDYRLLRVSSAIREMLVNRSFYGLNLSRVDCVGRQIFDLWYYS